MMDTNAAVAAHHKIALNGETVETAAQTLAELVAEAGFEGRKVATAVNGEFVAERARVETRLANGDHVEIVAPRQGG
jgi:sulfur carrier protein